MFFRSWIKSINISGLISDLTFKQIFFSAVFLEICQQISSFEFEIWFTGELMLNRCIYCHQPITVISTKMIIFWLNPRQTHWSRWCYKTNSKTMISRFLYHFWPLCCDTQFFPQWPKTLNHNKDWSFAHCSSFSLIWQKWWKTGKPESSAVLQPCFYIYFQMSPYIFKRIKSICLLITFSAAVKITQVLFYSISLYLKCCLVHFKSILVFWGRWWTEPYCPLLCHTGHGTIYLQT